MSNLPHTTVPASGYGWTARAPQELPPGSAVANLMAFYGSTTLGPRLTFTPPQQCPRSVAGDRLSQHRFITEDVRARFFASGTCRSAAAELVHGRLGNSCNVLSRIQTHTGCVPNLTLFIFLKKKKKKGSHFLSLSRMASRSPDPAHSVIRMLPC